jgi:uncharacterized metal-binding protein YceD (DUF177 family)
LNIKKNFGNIQFTGVSQKEGDIYIIKGKITGFVEVDCIKCLNTFKKEINEDVKFKVVKPPFSGFDEEYDIIEQEKFDLDEILKSEVESLKLDYNICKNCEKEEFNKEF